jgi:MFS family permease
LIFSIKQAGAPAGGALAGLVVAPIAARYGWQPALLVTIIAGSISAAAISPLREMMDAERDRGRSIQPKDILHYRNVLAPFAAVRGDALLISVTALAVSFSLVQGTLFSFSVTYLTQRGLSLERAGIAYACMQAAGVFARIFLGWFADRTGRPAWNLTAQAYVAGICVCAWASIPVDASFAAIALIATSCGFFGASWNGITMAEIARLSPPEQIVEATAGSTMFTFMGYAAGPSLFAAAVPLFGWRVPYAVAGVQLAVMAAVQTVILWRRSGRPNRR